MAKGKTHDTVTVSISIPAAIGIGILSFLYMGEKYVLLYMVLFYCGVQLQRYMGPDLDIDGGYFGFHVLRMKIGKIYKLWQWFWYPYAIMVRHRSWVSHAPIISTFIRYVYLLLPMWLLLSIWDINIIIYWEWILFLFMGTAVGDLFHIIFDYFPFLTE